MKKKILIVYGKYGSGHKSIAEYVYNYLKDNNKNIEIKLLDMTDYVNKIGKIAINFVNLIAKYRPSEFWNICYKLTNNKSSTLSVNAYARQSFNNKRLRKLISDFKPDITISTHYLCSSLIVYYNDLKLINTKLYTIITDYSLHKVWTVNYKKETGYIVGNEIVKNEMVLTGINKEKIYSFGLPLNVVQLNNLNNKNEIIKKYDLDENKKTYLFFGGSSAGSMYYYDYFKKLVKLNINANIIFISGKNKKLQNKCERFIKNKEIQNIKVLGYTNDVLNLMKISDLVITKPGGATVTECIEMHRPMILIPGVGGPEKYNAKYIISKKYGIIVKSLFSFKRTMKKIENKPNIIKKISQRMENMAQNKAVEKINNLIMKG